MTTWLDLRLCWLSSTFSLC